MKAQEHIDFQRIAEAIEYMQQHFTQQPELSEVAAQVHLSPYHFQRMFTEWAGTSPKKFLQYISIQHAKKMLKQDGATLFETAMETGFSGASRLHDLFVNIEGMTPGEYKNGGAGLDIRYSFAESPFGNILVASTHKGICYMAFAEEGNAALNDLKRHFPNAHYQQMLDRMQQNALYIFSHDWSKLHEIKLHLKGTDFQLKVWETLLKIPKGKLATYGDIARQIARPGASRAVGTAIGDNPVAFLIPCHRVIQSSGLLGGYHWGPVRKAAIIGWEAVHTELQA
ncbi:MAG: methylated-DNA--[protein]-cysteine S-methyltransferase [Bacteroidetes bacterium]|nr:methylated-DNA--[protein]-cysteine S-methyltransferase [Bacteroidota bacterium]